VPRRWKCHARSEVIEFNFKEIERLGRGTQRRFDSDFVLRRAFLSIELLDYGLKETRSASMRGLRD
jgi:hypothetical protein